MKNFLLLICVFGILKLPAQNWQTVEEVDDYCSDFYGFSSDLEVEKYVSLILAQIGIFNNTIAVKSCLEIKNCVAKNLLIKDTNGNSIKKPFIIYDPKFINKIEEQTGNTKWASIAILAHEIGHHQNQHTLNDIGSNHKVELEADEFSGFVLAKLGATLAEALIAVNNLPVHGSFSHPPQNQRKQAIEDGWNKGKNHILPKPKTEQEQAQQELAVADVYFFNKDYLQSLKIYNKWKNILDINQQMYMGYMYMQGVGGKIDYISAAYWSKKAAEQNNVYAQYNLGVVYYNGGYGIIQDYNTAIYWFKKAAEQNNADAQQKLGYIYMSGDGVQKNYTTSAYWSKKAAEQNNVYAQYNLGVVYYNGEYGIIQDYNTAIYWFKKAAEQNDANAQQKLGYIYMSGDGVQKNYTTSAYWSKKAAEQNNVYAQYNLGVVYYNGGYGIIQDYNTAIYWFKEAAKNGHKKSQEYCKSQGVTW